MSLLHDSADPTVDDATHRFRASTIDTALANARAYLGPHVEIVDANRIRRGGVGGFFATDLGVELVVRVPGAGPDPRSPNAADLQEPEYLEPEYLEPEYLDVGNAPQVLPRSTRHPEHTERGAGSDDRVVVEGARASNSEGAAPLSSGIDRLLASATRAERTVHGRSTPMTNSFAEQLAHHLGEHGPIVNDSMLRADRPRAASSETTVAASVPPVVPAGPDTTGVDGEPRSAAVTPSAPAVTAAATSPAPAEQSVPSRPSSPPRGPMRKPVELATGAVGRLVEQLSDVPSVDGSRMRDLTRLVVKVTTTDGTVIEIAAELDGDAHG
jgi:hypothetical protein